MSIYQATRRGIKILPQLNELKSTIEQKRPEIANWKVVMFHQPYMQSHVPLTTPHSTLELSWDSIVSTIFTRPRELRFPPISFITKLP
ncbi:hypothetical protein TNCV_2443691 [Trichonephila clavipes]|nr:hypothetical protein TNCV_2443691 [Trichonephila clavipes]